MIPLAFVLTLGATICWGLSQIVGKMALRTTDIFVLTAVRTSSASALLVLYILSTGGLEYFGVELTLLAVLMGVISWSAASVLFYSIMQRSAAHKVTPFSNTHPLWGVVTAMLFLGEEAKPTILLSVALVILGSYFLAQKEGSGGSERWKVMTLLALLVGIMWGATIALNKYCLSGGMSPTMFLLVGAVSASVVCNILRFVHSAKNGGNRMKFKERGVGLSILSGILALFAGQLLWQHALKIEEASALSPMIGAVIPLGFLFSILLLGEKPTRRAWGGMVTIFVGVLLVLM